MSQPTLDEILTAYAAMARVVLPAGVRIYDGPVVTGADPNHSLAIGHSDVPDEPGATIEDPTDSDADLPEWLQADVVTVTCTIEVKSGSSSDSAIPGLRILAMDTLATIRAALRGDFPLGLAGLAWARVGSVVYVPHQTTTGSNVIVTFETTFQSRASAT